MAAKFEFIRRLGAGYFGEVWLARDAGLGVVRAVKLVPPDRVPDENNFFREAQLLKDAEHSNVVKVEETGRLADGRIYVAMRFYERGSVDDEIKGAFMQLSRARRLMIDVLRGLEWAHSRGILHRDIKPANIIVGDSAEGLLSDFGLAVKGAVDPAKLGVRDYAYVLHKAPELCAGDEASELTDIYSAGVTLYRLVNGDSFLPALSLEDIETMVGEGRYPDRSKYRAFVPRPVRLLINKALSVDPSKRFASAAAMRRALEQIVVKMNWHEEALRRGARWTGRWDDISHEVVLEQLPNRQWSVQYRKGGDARHLRRVASACVVLPREAQARKLSESILQDVVMGRSVRGR